MTRRSTDRPHNGENPSVLRLPTFSRMAVPPIVENPAQDGGEPVLVLVPKFSASAS